VNYFANPAKVFSQVRAPILGIDTQTTIFEFSFIATNMLNHRQFTDAANGTLCLCTPVTWGVLNSQLNPPRAMEFGGRLTF
jgi:hypothetical protein